MFMKTPFALNLFVDYDKLNLLNPNVTTIKTYESRMICPPIDG